MEKELKSVGKSVRKKDSMQLLLGKPVYTDDVTGEALVVKLLRSPHAFAKIRSIDAARALKVPGVVGVPFCAAISSDVWSST